MHSLDTNVLFYAINRDAQEHDACRRVVEYALDTPGDWIIADQVWFELYRLLRHARLLARPLSAPDAADTVAWYRDRSGWRHCAWSPGLMTRLQPVWNDPAFAPRRTFDAVLATTLLANGVTTFYTRNTRDFEQAGFAVLRDPVTVQF